MNITPEMMYLITRLDGLTAFFTALVPLFLILTVLFVLVRIAHCMDNVIPRISNAYGVVFVSLLIFTILGKILVPTTKEMSAIIVVPAIANSETIRELGEDVVTMAKCWMESNIQHLKNGKL